MNNIERDLLDYGEFITDDEYQEKIDTRHWHIGRIRLISYQGELYYHKMINGVVVECRKVGKTL